MATQVVMMSAFLLLFMSVATNAQDCSLAKCRVGHMDCCNKRTCKPKDLTYYQQYWCGKDKSNYNQKTVISKCNSAHHCVAACNHMFCNHETCCDPKTCQPVNESADCDLMEGKQRFPGKCNKGICRRTDTECRFYQCEPTCCEGLFCFRMKSPKNCAPSRDKDLVGGTNCGLKCDDFTCSPSICKGQCCDDHTSGSCNPLDGVPCTVPVPEPHTCQRGQCLPKNQTLCEASCQDDCCKEVTCIPKPNGTECQGRGHSPGIRICQGGKCHECTRKMCGVPDDRCCSRNCRKKATATECGPGLACDDIGNCIKKTLISTTSAPSTSSVMMVSPLIKMALMARLIVRIA